MHLLLVVYCVSIPFSTIKRITGRKKKKLQDTFQFHLVRLKVSLPFSYSFNGFKFQFHLVRLKEWWIKTCDKYGYRFQFHLVRLKDYIKDIVSTNASFQFHLVRLKEIIEKRKKKLHDTFQFHLVRLKESKAVSSQKRCGTVSIPFSTIKRKEGLNYTCSAKVSIPFSTIKSYYGKEVSEPVPWFQFHLVRLKAGLGFRVPVRPSKFQFHLVRLKE